MQAVQHINGCQLTSETDNYGILEWLSLFIGFLIVILILVCNKA